MRIDAANYGLLGTVFSDVRDAVTQQKPMDSVSLILAISLLLLAVIVVGTFIANTFRKRPKQ